jgi:hypothetical protein
VTARFTAPEAAAGKTEYETEGLRLRIVDPTGRGETYGVTGILPAKLVVENRRDHFAWIKAERSCLVDAEEGATNLLWHDACIPGKSWTSLGHASPGMITVNWFPTMRPPHVLATSASQRVLLDVAWEDGKTEWVDLSYDVEVTEPGAR